LYYIILIIILSLVGLSGREVMTAMGTQELLTTEAVATILRMTREAVSRKVQKGEIPGVKIGKRWLIGKETLESLLALPTPQG
jgi:excisionase family DNA binding protein